MSSQVIHIALCAIVSVPAHILYLFMPQISSWIESNSRISQATSPTFEYTAVLLSGKKWRVALRHLGMGKLVLDPEVIMKVTD